MTLIKIKNLNQKFVIYDIHCKGDILKVKILGITASLRNARCGKENRISANELKSCRTEAELKKYLHKQANLHLQNFINSGRGLQLPFNQIYKNLKKSSGKSKGFSNTEVALASALWTAAGTGVEIEHLSLSEHFPASGKPKNLEKLKSALILADGIIVSTPVYFGDRGSLAQELIDFIRNDKDLQLQMDHKVYAGIAVGAKRNGGQETTLIYQLLDMIDLGFFGVGNDSDTTAQYGGTGHAGDVGTMSGDDYGLWTSMGVGRRIAHVSTLVKKTENVKLKDKANILFLILQDKDDKALKYVNELIEPFKNIIKPTILDINQQNFKRCIACDVCPTHIGPDEDYRCIIKGGATDNMASLHKHFLNQDAIVPVVYCPDDKEGLVSNYQLFIERTRYLRRGDYILSDCLAAPLVLQDIGSMDNMHIRILTSLIRHHTVLLKPMIGSLYKEEILNNEQIKSKFKNFVNKTIALTLGRHIAALKDKEGAGITRYNPVGYIISVEKDKEDEKLCLRNKMVKQRQNRLNAVARKKLLLTDNTKTK